MEIRNKINPKRVYRTQEGRTIPFESGKRERAFEISSKYGRIKYAVDTPEQALALYAESNRMTVEETADGPRLIVTKTGQEASFVVKGSAYDKRPTVLASPDPTRPDPVQRRKAVEERADKVSQPARKEPAKQEPVADPDADVEAAAGVDA